MPRSRSVAGLNAPLLLAAQSSRKATRRKSWSPTDSGDWRARSTAYRTTGPMAARRVPTQRYRASSRSPHVRRPAKASMSRSRPLPYCRLRIDREVGLEVCGTSFEGDEWYEASCVGGSRSLI